MARLTNRLLLYAFVFLLAEAIWSVPELNWEVALARTGPLGWVVASVAAALALVLAWCLRRQIFAASQKIADRALALRSSTWFLVCLVLGMLLRALWWIRYPAPLRSDYGTYFGLAKGLAENHVYGSPAAGLAFWPPGYPFVLSVFFSLFGAHTWIPFLVNAVLFTITIGAVNWLARIAAGESTARLATLLLVFWPCFFMSGELASKEMLVLALIPLSLALYLASVHSSSPFRRALFLVFAGLTVGLMTLTQPSLMLFPAVLLGYEFLRASPVPSATLRLAVLAIVTLLVISPWTIRNYHVLGSWVPISSNGGDVFYRANNERATGAFTEAGTQTTSDLDEVSRSKIGYALGKEWIRQHPGHFALLALRKQVLFLGDDATGAYETLKRGLGIGGIQYIAWKGFSNLYWWTICLLMALAVVGHRASLQNTPEITALILSILYLYAMHSVFESGGKYHIPLIGVLSIMAGLCAFRSPSEVDSQPTAPRAVAEPPSLPVSALAH